MFSVTIRDLRTLLQIEAERLFQLAQTAPEGDEFTRCLGRVMELNIELQRVRIPS